MDKISLFERFMPHGHCFLWKTDIMLGFVLGDIITFISYIVIPTRILFAVRAGTFDGLEALMPTAKLTALFIYCCGIGHALGALNIYVGLYTLQSYWNLVTGIVSAFTAYRYVKLVNFLGR